MKPHSVWRLPAVGVVNLSNTGNRREPLYEAGYRRMDVLIAEGDRVVWDNITELLNIGPGLLQQGWTICSWHSTTGEESPGEEADTALEALVMVRHLMSGHNLNAEDWYEGTHKWKTSAYWERFRKLSELPVAVWPMGSDAPAFPRNFDYETCVALGCMVYPQQYQNVHPSLTIENGDANLETAGVPVENRGTSPGCYIGTGAPSVPWDAYSESLDRVNRPVLLYAADLGGFDPAQAAKLVKEGEDDMQVIGEQDGIVAKYNRLRDLDPEGTLLRKNVPHPTKPGVFVWEDISALDATPISKWKAYDKAQRTEQILKDDHDEAASS